MLVQFFSGLPLWFVSALLVSENLLWDKLSCDCFFQYEIPLCFRGGAVRHIKCSSEASGQLFFVLLTFISPQRLRESSDHAQILFLIAISIMLTMWYIIFSLFVISD